MAATQPVSPVRKLHVPTKKLERNRTSTAVQSAPVMNLSPLFAKSAENNLSRQEMISTYFDLYDPLKDRVPNQKNYSDQLYQISSSANFDFTTSNSEDVEVPAVDIDLSKKSYIEYSFDEKVPEYAKHENHEEEEKEIPQPVKVNLLQQPRHKIDHDIDMAMLLNSPLIATLLSNDDDDEEDLHARINKVFDELGFSAKQKLDLALKYSDTESNGITLTDAVFNWERILDCYKLYEKTYQEVKSQLKVATGYDLADDSFIETKKKMLDNAELKMKSVMNRYEEMIGGPLFIKGHDIESIFKKRKNSLLSYISSL